MRQATTKGWGLTILGTAFAVAVIMLMVTVSIVLAMAVRDRMQGVWGWIAAIIAGGVLVNAAAHVLPVS